MKPLIGVIADYREGGQPGDYSSRPYYGMRKNHVDMINQAGGAVIILPYDYDLIDRYISMIDGLVIVGGPFDIDPKYYGEEAHEKVKYNKTRENFEREFMTKFIKTDKPYLGICNGMQLLNILQGGSAIQHIPDHKEFIDHEQSHDENFKDYGKAYHDVIVEKGTKLYDIVGADKIKVNSSHHQAAKAIGKGLIVSGKSPDGIIEAIENPNHKFCVAVQWHPEFGCSDADYKIHKAFIQSC